MGSLPNHLQIHRRFLDELPEDPKTCLALRSCLVAIVKLLWSTHEQSTRPYHFGSKYKVLKDPIVILGRKKYAA